MNRRVLWFIGGFGAVFAAEAIPGTPVAVEQAVIPEASARQQAERIDRFVLEGPRFLRDVTRIPLSELRALAPLRDEQVKKAANLHDPLKVDEYRTLVFEGLEVYGYIGDQQELWPIRITVSAPTWAIAEDLKVGSDTAQVIEILGEPTVRNPGVWLYQGTIQNVNFYLNRDKVGKIEFIYYLD